MQRSLEAERDKLAASSLPDFLGALGSLDFVAQAKDRISRIRTMFNEIDTCNTEED